MYTSLKQFYKDMMFSENRWTLAELDQLDVHFFDELTDIEEVKEDVYLSDIW